MHSSLIQIAGHEAVGQFDNHLSFRPLLEYLKCRLKEEQAIKPEFYRFVLKQFEKKIQDADELDPAKAEELIEQIKQQAEEASKTAGGFP